MHPAVAMNDDEIQEVLSQPRPMRFATYSPDGFPHVVPVWHACIDDAVYFDTDEDSVKVRNVRETGVGAGVVDDGSKYTELRGVLIQGKASVVEDEDEREKVLLHNLDKYFDGEIPEMVRQRNEMVDRVSIKLEKDHVTSWDFSKVFAP
ncbi:MAG: pyridoxamine 5'-phosphate oxidase family protein [Halobacteria archaeon]